MRRACAIVALLFLAAAPRAQAQAPPIPPAPPRPPPTMPPPLAWQPQAPYVLGPSPMQIDALEAAGRRKKRVGAALMATGGTLIAVGAGLMIGGAFGGNDHGCFGRQHRYARDGYYYDGYRAGCRDTALTVAGATTALVGVGALVPGIIEHVGGANDVDEAQRLRRCAGICWRPSVGPSGGGIELEMTR